MKLRDCFLFFLVLTLVVLGRSAYAQPQDKSPYLRKATIEYQGLRFTSAIRELKKVLDRNPENVRAQEMMAASSRNIKDYDEALYWYGELCKLKNIKPEWALYYAEALANKERYEESEQWYRKYLTLKPTDRRAAAFSKADMKAISAKAGDYKVVYLNMNTDASEYSPMYYQDGLLFISNREQKSRFVFQWDRTAYSDMYVVKDLEDIIEGEPDRPSFSGIRKSSNSSAIEERSLLSLFSSSKLAEDDSAEPQLLRGKVKSSYHEGPAALLPEGSLIFTRNNYIAGKYGKSREGINKLKLYTASGDNWEKITSFPYNNNEYSVGHPTVSTDGKILIFASDMPRGFGGTDLYYCVRTGDNKKWGRPVNFGAKINTEGNEQFPYLDSKGKLYFSSTGHPGLGGLDIFEIILKDLKPVGKPVNLGSDINSSSDDFGFIQDTDGKTGFFSSNRRGNDDIYQFTKMTYTVTLKGLVLDEATGQPLLGSRVILQHSGEKDTLFVDSKGEFKRALARQTDYELTGSNFAFVSEQSYVSTTGIAVDSTINVVLKLNKAGNLQQWVIDNCESLKKMFDFRNIYYDLDRAEIRSDATAVLDEIAETMVKNPAIKIVSASHTDSRATSNYNRELSLRRGEEVKAYLVSKGIEADRVEVRFYGKSRLLNLCEEGVICSEADQQMNRRTEFEVVLNGVNLSSLICN